MPNDYFSKSPSIVLLLILSSCSGTTRLNSDDFNAAEERIEILKQQVVFSPTVNDAEFDLYNVNGFGESNGLSIPGASSSDYKFTVKVDPANISKWVTGLTEVDAEHADYSWTNDIIKSRKQSWSTSSKPVYYAKQGLPDGWSTILVVYAEGIIFKRVIAN